VDHSPTSNAEIINAPHTSSSSSTGKNFVYLADENAVVFRVVEIQNS
jgi:hypothetical protein